MANGLGGLAQGFIQGAGLGMRMRQQEQTEKEQGELSKLRKSAEARRESAETRAQETHEQAKSLRKLQMERIGKMEERAESAEKRAEAGLELRKKESDWRVAKDERAEKDKKLASLAPIEYQRVSQGGEFSPEFMAEAEGTRFDPVYMATPEFRESATNVYNKVSDLVAKAKGGTDGIGLADVNDPSFLQSLDVLMAPDVKRGVGTKDPQTGKTIVNKEIGMIVPYENKGLVIDAKITLDDGTSYFAPITEGRSTDPDDPVKIIPIDKFIDSVEGYTRMASAYNQPDLQSAVTRYTGTPTKPNASAEVTKRQYLRELGDIDRDETKELAKLNNNQMLEPNDKKKAIEEVSSKYEELRAKTNARYGRNAPKPVGKGEASVQQPRGGGQKMIDVDTWAGDDPKKLEFIKSGEQYASESGESPFDAFSPSEIDKIYMEWSNQKEADELAELLKQ